MNPRPAPIILVIILLFTAGCSYRFVDPFPASEFDLESVRNATSEPGLAGLLEDELRRNGGFKDSAIYRLNVAVTRFEESVDSVGSSGSPVRQKLVMEVAWKIEGARLAQAVLGNKVIDRTYPYSADLTTLDWNRNAALRLLAETAAREILEDIGARP
jgi:hypothetical protein